MRRWLPIAAFSLILMTLPLWAQRGGGGSHGGGAHFASRGGSSVHSSFSGAVGGRNFGRTSGIHIRTGNPSHNHRGFDGRRHYPFYYPYAGYYPYGFYGWYDDPLAYDDSGEDDQDAYASYQAPSYPTPYSENSGLQRNVQSLNGKVDRLQAEVQARNQPEAEPETALVFRDQHVEEVRNYAISGGALWVLNAQASKKIPLVNLDIEATVKMNEDRGVDFQVPEPSLQIMIVR